MSDMREVADYLRKYNAWRRGEDERMMHEAGIVPAELGRMLDAAVALLEGQAARPQLAQQGSVPESIATDDDVERVAKVAGWDNRKYMTPPDYSEWCRRMREFVRLSATPQPEGDGWVKCENRLPTEEDGDYYWDVFTYSLGGGVCRKHYGDINSGNTHWKPTGLNRPQPPQEGSGNEH